MESTDIARLILEADQRGFPEVQAAVAATRQKLDALAVGYQAGTVPLEDYLEKGRILQGELDGLRDGLDKATKALKKHGDAQSALAALTAQSTNKMAGLGQAGLQTGRVIQDFAQGGIGGILNNVEGLSMALGGGPGLAGLLTMVGVAAFIAKPFLVEFYNLLAGEKVKAFTSEIEALKAQLDKLGDKKVKAAIDYSDIDEAKRRLTELEKAQAEYDSKHHTSDQAEAGKVFAEMLANAPGGEDATKEKIQSRIVNDRSQGDPELQAALKQEAEEQLEMDNLKGVPGLAATQARARHEKKLAEAKEAKDRRSRRIEQDAEQEVGGMLLEGKAGDVNQINRYRSELEKVGQGDLSTMLGIFANPDEIRAQHKEKVELARQRRMAELDKTLKDKAAKEGKEQGKLDLKDDKLADKLNEQGAENERLMYAKKAGDDAKDLGEAQRQSNHRQAEVDRKLGERQKTLQGTSIDEQAAAASMRMRAAGMGEQARRQQLMQMFREAIKQAMPDLGMGERVQLAQRMTDQAEGQSGQQYERARMDLAQQGFRGHQLTAAAMQQALQTTTALAQQHAMLTGEVHQLRQGFMRLEAYIRRQQPRAAHAQRTNGAG